MRRGYVFTLDALFAILILLIALFVLFAQLPDAGNDFYTDRMAQDIINVLSHTKTTDLCTIGTTCDCPNYPALQEVVCDDNIRGKDASILEVFSEVILTGALPPEDIEDAIHEMFVEKAIIDERRFGFAILFTDESDDPQELYNTQTYVGAP